MDAGVDAIYYPCMSFNFDEHLGDNHYNCPVVAYYPETIAANVAMRNGVTLINDYAGPHKRHDFPEKMTQILQNYFSGITRGAVKRAAEKAYDSPGCISGGGAAEGRRDYSSMPAAQESALSAWRAGPTMPIRKSTTASIC